MRAILSPQVPYLLPRPIPSGNQEVGFGLSWKTTLPLVPLPPPPPPRLTARLRLRRCRASPDERAHGIAARRYARRSTSTRVSAGWHGREVGSQTHWHPAKRTGLPRSPRGAATHIQRVPRCSSAVLHKSRQALYNQLWRSVRSRSRSPNCQHTPLLPTRRITSVKPFPFKRRIAPERRRHNPSHRLIMLLRAGLRARAVSSRKAVGTARRLCGMRRGIRLFRAWRRSSLIAIARAISYRRIAQMRLEQLRQRQLHWRILRGRRESSTVWRLRLRLRLLLIRVRLEMTRRKARCCRGGDRR